MTKWKTVLTLDSQRQTESGDATLLADAIRAGADMRVGTAFRHKEHIDPTSDSNELIREVIDLRITHLLEDRWVAGIENLRVPIQLPDGFGPRESMSFFLYNQDGHQAIARPFLDERPATERPVLHHWQTTVPRQSTMSWKTLTRRRTHPAAISFTTSSISATWFARIGPKCSPLMPTAP